MLFLLKLYFNFKNIFILIFVFFYFIQFQLSESDDGSGKGAALIAIVADHFAKKIFKSTINWDDNDEEETRTQFHKHLYNTTVIPISQSQFRIFL